MSDNGSHRADDLTSSVRYDKLIATAVRVVSGPSHATVEVLAEALAIAILGEFKLVEAVRVGVAKLHPPMNEIVERVGIRVKVARTDLEKLTASPS